MSNAEMAKQLGVPESSSLDLLHTLQQKGYLLRTERSKRFYPTPRLFSIASNLAGKNPLAAASDEVLELIRDATGETTICAVLADHHVEVIGVRQGTHELRYMLTEGRRMALHVSAVGKALLSELEPAVARQLLGDKPLKAVTLHSVTDPETLMAQLHAARQQGLSETADEGTEGVSAMAVAGHIGGHLLAFSIFGPTDRVRRNRAAYSGALLKAKEMAFGTENQLDRVS